MPLHYFTTDSPNKIPIDYKARLEKKLYLVRENPEPIFDLSECNLKQLPHNIFTICRVFRKDALYLQSNLLSNFRQGGSLQELSNLKILNISSNKFRALPPDINELKFLEILDISKNELQELPSEIGALKNLKSLDASHNNLQNLPSSIGNCQHLEVLNVACNKPLKKLPKTLGKLEGLVKLKIDPTIIYPSKEICQNGLGCIMNFLHTELLDDLITPSTSTKMLMDYSSHKKIEKGKEMELEAYEQEVISYNLKESKLLRETKDIKNKLLANIISEQQAFDRKLAKVQHQKYAERAILVKACQKENENFSEAISKILKENKKLRVHILELQESERKEDEKLTSFAAATNINTPSTRQQILASMDQRMREEIKKYQAINDGQRLQTIKSLAAEIAFKNINFEELIKKNYENKRQLINTILIDEEIQKSVVISLLEESDATSWKLAKQISILEKKLAELTRIELSNKKREADYLMSEMYMDRIALTKILMQLFDVQRERKKQLIEKIRRLEALRQENQDVNNFWFQQYESLLRSKSNEMVKFLEALNPTLVQELFINGAFQHLPLLKDYVSDVRKLERLDKITLRKLGVSNAEDRRKILHAVQTFLKRDLMMNSECVQELIPSAPDFEEPSAPLIDQDFNNSLSVKYTVPEECVICLDSLPILIFVPCGHVCCCYNCFKAITLCPICRKSIDETHEVSSLKPLEF